MRRYYSIIKSLIRDNQISEEDLFIIYDYRSYEYVSNTILGSVVDRCNKIMSRTESTIRYRIDCKLRNRISRRYMKLRGSKDESKFINPSIIFILNNKLISDIPIIITINLRNSEVITNNSKDFDDDDSLELVKLLSMDKSMLDRYIIRLS